MADRLSAVFLDNVTYYRTETGGIAICLTTVARLVFAAIGAVLLAVPAIALLPFWLAVLVTVAGAALGYAWAGRPSTLFDCDRRVMVKHFRQIPFTELERFHTIERRDEESRMSAMLELLAGPRLVVRHEVYTRVRGQVVVVAHCSSRTSATELVDVINTLLPPKR